MEYYNFIQSVVAYVESRVKAPISYKSLEGEAGYSLPYIRQLFKSSTNTTLSRYILLRRISNAAFEMIHSSRNITDIALDYGFESYDTYTRAFKRITGITPSEFIRQRYEVGRIKLTAGVYGPGFSADAYKRNSHQEIKEDNYMKNAKKTENSCILYGVPKVQYSFEECTPFPSSLKACLNYMGQEICYSYLMAASGAAFRLRWNTKSWDGGNVDIMCIYNNPYEAFQRSFKAAGRDFFIKSRTNETHKEEFMEFIKKEIDEGRPVIALGIIGPPEACIVTGYRNGGNTLLGWNFFQDNPEFTKGITIDETGYFVSQDWWENPCTIGVMSIGEDKGDSTDIKDILTNAIDIMTKSEIGEYAGGQPAYDCWAKAMADDNQFPKGAILPILYERIMCQGDAMTMIGEGRGYAGVFINWVGEQIPELYEQCKTAAGYFKEEYNIVHRMKDLLGSWQHGETQARRLAEPEIRNKISALVLEAKELDFKACDILKKIVKAMD